MKRVDVIFSFLFRYIQLAPPLVTGKIMTATIRIVTDEMTLYKLLFNIDVYCITNIPP